MSSKANQPHWEKIGSLNCYVIPGVPQGPCIILFHGYGADAGDLVPLTNFLSFPKGATWIFPDGSLEVVIGPGMTGKAWFPIDMKAIEAAMIKGTHRDMSGSRPDGLENAAVKGHELLNIVKQRYSNYVIGGFSQGAMLATELTLSTVEKPGALVTLSATLLDGQNWEQMAKSCSGMPVFQSHGESDPLLGFQQSQGLRRIFEVSGMLVEFHSFKGGHEIPSSILTRLNKFLGNIAL